MMPLIKRLVIVLITLHFPLILLGQVDSLRQALKNTKSPEEKAYLLGQLSFAISSAHPDSTIILARQGAQIASSMHLEKELATCLSSIGWAYYYLGNNDSSEYYLTRGIQMCHSSGRKKDEARVLINLSTLYESEKNYESALQALMTAKDLAEATKDDEASAYIDKMIGSIYRNQGVLDKGKFYIKESIESFKRLNDSLYLADALSSLGSLYLLEKNYDSAFFCFRRCSELYKRSGNLTNLAYSIENIADVYISIGRTKLHPATDSALFYYRRAYQIFNSLNNAENELYEKFKIGVALNMLGQYNEAAEDLKLALDHFDSSKEMDNTYAIDTELSSVYEHEGDYKQAYYYLDRAGVYKDSLDKRNRNEMMANMLAKYDAAKKDKAFILLNERQAATQHRLARTRVITILSLGLLAVIIILAITLVNRYRIKQRLRQMEMRNQLASDLHDDIGGSLSSILLLSKMASQNIPANSGNAALINKISTNSKEVMERMSDIVWATNPKFDSGTNLKERLENYIIQVRQMSHLDVTANISDDISEIKFPVLMRKNIYLVCKEAVNNILKHAEATELIIEIGVDHKMLTMLIKDNGKGFDTSRSFQGIGLETMVLRVKACEGELDMQSCPGKGTTISILIPVPHSRYFA